MDRRAKATQHRDEGKRLNRAWNVGAVQARYHEGGYWYAKLSQFPAALFDANGYVLFATASDYENTHQLRIGKQISIRKPGISAIPGYVSALASTTSPAIDVDIHQVEEAEGQRRLVQHLQCERKKSVVRRKKASVASLECEICGFLFSRSYGPQAADYCEVHHLIPLGQSDEATRTKLRDLAILCANCHRVVHLRNPPYTLQEVRSMLSVAREA